jgi:hypothetical protein
MMVPMSVAVVVPLRVVGRVVVRSLRRADTIGVAGQRSAI